ncbi:EamA family transporter [Natronosalvus vescus]|uniref:EamA family transporter n=1 Tax=Natronosalvus vescus TaxID=2953881 RepID=UPI00209192F3|nr:EamA family transporter [Natronosalvus vescus]
MIPELPQPILGILLASLAAIMWAIQYLCVRVGTDDGDVLSAVIVTIAVNLALLAPAVLVVYPRPYSGLFTPLSLVAFTAAGLVGTLLARLLMYKSIETIGASRTSPVIAANVFFATVLAVVFLEESLTFVHVVGIVLIVGGVAVISWDTASSEPDQSLRELGLSLLLPVVAAAAIGIEPIFVSIGLEEGTPAIPGVLAMTAAGGIGFVGYLLWRRQPVQLSVRSPSTAWYVAAGVSSAIGLVTYFAALEVAPVVIVVPLLQTTPLLVVVLSALFLPQRLERVTLLTVVAALVVVGGAILVSVSG